MDESAIFAAALEHADPKLRRTFLESACQGDLELQARILGLLWAHEHPDDFLDSPVVTSSPNRGDERFPDTIELPSSIETAGSQIGPYKLLQEIGQGGMGVVYMAEQTEPVERRVALKIIKPGMDTRQVIARFEAERQALALMDHPNIAKVLDAATTDAGQPYFVMELVKGVPITKYCDNAHLTPTERLELFIPICQAVQHAHQKGIIHRDLKPSNVLVTKYDGRPVPKVIDFGVAKAITHKLTEKTMFTQYGQIVGTMEYMSPEQSEVNQVDVDTRSDVYSLGVLLYELLTGVTPFDRKRLRSAAFAEMLRIIREEEPLRPSMRLSTIDTLPSVAASRRIEPRGLRKLVRGELDWIVMKALEKDRARRYDTASALAADVQNFLSEAPVQACPPSPLYRLGKVLRRYRVAASVAGSFVVLLIASSIISWGLYASARAANIVAKANEQRALIEERKATENAERADQGRYLSDMQSAAATWDSPEGAEWHVRELLKAHLPGPGGHDRRDFAWHYQWNLLENNSVTYPGVASAAFATDGHFVTLDADFNVLHWGQSTSEPRRRVPLEGLPNISFFELSPSGTRVVLTSNDGMVHLLDTLTGQQTSVLPVGIGPIATRFSPDDHRLTTLRFGTEPSEASGQEDVSNPNSLPSLRDGEVEVRIWDVATGQALQRSVRRVSTMIAQMWNGLYSRSLVEDHLTAVSDDGQVIVAGRDPIHSWATAYRHGSRQVFGGASTSIQSVACSPDGELAALGKGGGQVILWRTASEADFEEIVPHNAAVPALAFSPDGLLLATGGYEGRVTVWDVAKRRELFRFKGHTEPIESLRFSADSGLLLSVDQGGTAKRWSVESDAFRRSLPAITSSRDLAYSPDGKWLGIAAISHTELWALRPERRVHRLPAEATAVAFLPDSKTMVTGEASRTIRVWDVATGRQLRTIESRPPPNDNPEMWHDDCASIDVSPDGKFVAAGYGSRFWYELAEYKQSVDVMDISSGELVAKLPHPQTVANVSFSPDGELLATACHDKTIRLWQVDSWEETHVFPGPEVFKCVAFSPDSEKLAAGNYYGAITVWDVRTRREIRTLLGHSNRCHGLSFSPRDRDLLASTGDDNSVRLWDAASGRQLRAIHTPSAPGFCVSFAPDGRTVASGGFQLFLWETAPQLWQNPVEAAKTIDQGLQAASDWRHRKKLLATSIVHSETLEELAKLRPLDPQVQVAMARSMWVVDRDDRVAAHVRRARDLFEQRVAESPDDDTLSHVFAEFLLETAPGSDGWSVLRPAVTKSEAGARLNVLQDSSVLVSGEPAMDTYDISGEVEHGGVTSIRLEALPDPSLPANGPGRSLGGFVLNELQVFAQSSSDPTKQVALPLSNANATVSEAYYGVSKAIDGDMGATRFSGWSIGESLGQPEVAYFGLAQPLGEEQTLLTFKIHHTDPRGGLALGRFRISTSDGPPEPSQRELFRLALRFAEDWPGNTRLAAVRYLLGEKDQARDLLVGRVQNSERVCDWLFLALLEQQAGKTADARQAWDTAVQRMQQVTCGPAERRLASVVMSDVTELDANAAEVQLSELLEEGHVAELTAAIEANPESREHYHERAAMYARLGQWQPAAADYTRAIELDPAVFRYRYLLAILLAEAGQAGRYGRHVRDLLELVEKSFTLSGDPVIAEQTAKACVLLADGDVEVLRRAAKLADYAMTTEKSVWRLPWVRLTKGMVEFRRGHLTAAVELLNQTASDTTLNGLRYYRSTAYYFLAMAHQQLGDANEAIRLMRAAEEVSDHDFATVDTDLGKTWPDWLIARISRREAESSVLPEQPNAADNQVPVIETVN